jgi:hypothetical protein
MQNQLLGFATDAALQDSRANSGVVMKPVLLNCPEGCAALRVPVWPFMATLSFGLGVFAIFAYLCVVATYRGRGRHHLRPIRGSKGLRKVRPEGPGINGSQQRCSSAAAAQQPRLSIWKFYIGMVTFSSTMRAGLCA